MTVEQRAIELVSNLGKEHLFVANCPSDIDADKMPVRSLLMKKPLIIVTQELDCVCYLLRKLVLTKTFLCTLFYLSQ